MNILINVADNFGSSCDNGDAAAKFRHAYLDRYLESFEMIEFEFLGVQDISRAFANSLIGSLVTQSSVSMIRKLKFNNCRTNVNQLIEEALMLAAPHVTANV